MQKLLEQIVEPLLKWYGENARILPWRDDPTPYRVWISEIMLQQTRVAAVMPYYERFLRTLPNVAALAGVSDAELMKLWEGLGYYSRAHNLKKAANIIMDEYNGELPASFDTLLGLPGIGGYTAGAISSIAFNISMPAVDGNVLRVISRVTESRDDIMDSKVKQRMEKEIAAILPDGRVGDFNQSLMELGATVCLPNGDPLCKKCPLAFLCKAHKSGATTEIPVKAAKKKRRIEQKAVFVIVSGNEVALLQRPDTGLLAGLWEFPNTQGAPDPKVAENFLKEHGITDYEISPLPNAKHIFTHIEWHMGGYLIRTTGKSGCFTWSGAEELKDTYALPSAFRVYLKAARDNLLR